MLENWVKETTTTTGTGTITLAGAVTGFIAFSDVIADGEQVEYFIESGNNRERGIGTFTASGTTLARTVILETLVSGTYDDTSPAAITLAGTSDVYISGPAQRIMNGPVIMVGPTESSSWDCLDNIAHFDSVSTTVSTANRMLITIGPLLVPRIMTTLRFYVATADATCTHLRLGLYKIDKDGEPGDVLYDSGDLSASAASTGAKSHTISGGPIHVPAGIYGAAVVSDSTTLALRGCTYATIAGPGFGLNSLNNFRRYCHRVDTVTGALPNDPTTAFSQVNRAVFGWR
jgi:hypothetical protein